MIYLVLAKKVQSFLLENHSEACTAKTPSPSSWVSLSFPVNQTALNRGTLIRWTKGFDIPDTVDRDVVELLQANLTILEVNVKVVAIANDTVGTLLTAAYSNDSANTNRNTIIGCIFGTGTNGAYFESKIPKLSSSTGKSQGMVINTEWGSFDNGLKILPSTEFDEIVDSETANPGYHLFEKRISGMFLGEILRVALIHLFKRV